MKMTSTQLKAVILGELCHYAEKKMGGFCRKRRKKKDVVWDRLSQFAPGTPIEDAPSFLGALVMLWKKTTLSCVLFKFRFLCPVF